MTEAALPFRHETDRLVLRDWGDGDWEEFVRLTNTPAVMRWLGGVADEDERRAARQRLEHYHREAGHTFWVCERKSDGGHLSGELLGFCGLKLSNATGQKVEGMVEAGWRLREEAWGHGYAKEAAIATLDVGFRRFDADQIIALTVPGNKPSWGLMERLGMHRRDDLEFHDPGYGPQLNPTIVYLITAKEWEAGEYG